MTSNPSKKRIPSSVPQKKRDLQLCWTVSATGSYVFLTMHYIISTLCSFLLNDIIKTAQMCFKDLKKVILCHLDCTKRNYSMPLFFPAWFWTQLEELLHHDVLLKFAFQSIFIFPVSWHCSIRCVRTWQLLVSNSGTYASQRLKNYSKCELVVGW